MKIVVNTTYYAGGMSIVELPEGRTWDDVDDWFIKWDELHITWEDGTSFTKALDTDVLDGLDCKHPVGVNIVDEDTERTLAEE